MAISQHIKPFRNTENINPNKYLKLHPWEICHVGFRKHKPTCITRINVNRSASSFKSYFIITKTSFTSSFSAIQVIVSNQLKRYIQLQKVQKAENELFDNPDETEFNVYLFIKERNGKLKKMCAEISHM